MSEVPLKRVFMRWSVLSEHKLISQKVFTKSFCKSQFPHESVNLFFALVRMKDTFTNLYENRLLQNDLMNTLCEMNQPPEVNRTVPDCENNCFAVMRSSSKEGSYLRRVGFCITQL